LSIDIAADAIVVWWPRCIPIIVS